MFQLVSQCHHPTFSPLIPKPCSVKSEHYVQYSWFLIGWLSALIELSANQKPGILGLMLQFNWAQFLNQWTNIGWWCWETSWTIFFGWTPPEKTRELLLYRVFFCRKPFPWCLYGSIDDNKFLPSYHEDSTNCSSHRSTDVQSHRSFTARVTEWQQWLLFGVSCPNFSSATNPAKLSTSSCI